MAKWTPTKGAQLRYEVQLRKVAKAVASIVEAHTDGATIRNPEGMRRQLEAYSDALGPWASRLVDKLLRDVSTSNMRTWQQQSSAISKELKSVLAESQVGQVARMLHTAQVDLIKSLPTDAAVRAQTLAQSAATGGRRASEVAADLLRTEEVTLSRATLIARTEIAKANSAIVQARAQYVGATHYYWRTAEDAEVRETHADLDGEIFAFDNPPEIEGEGRHGPGEIWNCRCYAEPIIPGDPGSDNAE